MKLTNLARSNPHALIVALTFALGVATAPTAFADEAAAAGDESSQSTSTQQQTRTKAASGRGQSNILDFEGDVIEGQKKTPELFLQTEIDRPTLDTVLYQRRHFNDYHKTDSRQRPRASDPPK